MQPRRLISVFATCSLFTLVACSAGSAPLSGADAAPPAATNATEPPAADETCKEKYAASRGLSEACCIGWGLDACGAGLFCAALDGRKQTTCYPEGSRVDGQSCTADVQCASRACAPSGVCKGVPAAPTSSPTSTPDGGPQPAKCVSGCTSNSACQSTCPAVPGRIACCDRPTGLCYVSASPACP